MRTIIVGGGFAGIQAALEISKRQLGKITLISSTPYFLHHDNIYSTILHSNDRTAMIPLDEIFAYHPDVSIVQDTLISLDPDRHLAITKKKSYHYDSLILALGSTTEYFNINGARQHSISPQTLQGIHQIRTRIDDAMISDRRTHPVFTIVGGGQSGVELAGALADHSHDIAHGRRKKSNVVTIQIIEKQNRLVPSLSKTASRRITSHLRVLGVHVLTGQTVSRIGTHSITVNGRSFPSDTVIWATGTKNSSFFSTHPSYFQVDKNGKVLVNPYLEAYRNIYVLGDNTNIQRTDSTRNALDMGRFIAKHLERIMTGRQLQPFHRVITPTSVAIGNNWAYYERFGVYIDGQLGYLVRRRRDLKTLRRILPATMAKEIWQARHSNNKSQ